MLGKTIVPASLLGNFLVATCAFQPSLGRSIPSQVLLATNCFLRLASSSSHLYSSSSSSQEQEIQQTLSPGLHSSEIEVKKSRFIAYAASVDSWPAAQQYIDQLRNTDHPKARHWCYGFRLGTNERCSDDGEPSGTAGAPILNAIHGESIVDAVCIVVRYFGGVKLGAGGLIRAYGGAARQVLREAPRVTRIPHATVRLRVEAGLVGTVYEQMGRFEGTPSDETYGDDGSLEMTVTCEKARVESFKDGLRDSTRGKVTFDED